MPKTMETISFILATVFMVEDSPSENGSPHSPSRSEAGGSKLNPISDSIIISQKVLFSLISSIFTQPALSECSWHGSH